jgi:D-alanyl-lipoteichoic acid acyltransferase DltB (MBOAT superfamily)
MLFTSLPFILFFIVVFSLYWFVLHRNLKLQNCLLLGSSYVFYGWWDWRFLLLLFFISVSNYLLAIEIRKKEKKSQRKPFFLAALIVNLGTLIIFKYFNFFVDGFASIISLTGFKVSIVTFNIILPLGISFYIFLSLSYIIDVYQNKIEAVRNVFDALLTFSFFPIILAGPIQRPIGLLPQIQSKRLFDNVLIESGLKQILWGVFMKMVIADNCVGYVTTIFNGYESYHGSTLVLGAFLFTVQIYTDFAGYSNIAIGIGKLLGFNIIQNFAYPYFSRDIRDFWKRWNMSLTTWFRDYTFLPVAYWVSGKIKSEKFYFIKTEILIYITGITVTWMLTGLWHGANYTFIVWGLIQGVFLIIYHVSLKPRKRLLKRINLSNNNKIFIFVETLITLTIIMFSWIFFRADTLGDAFKYISGILNSSLFSPTDIKTDSVLLSLIALFFVVEWIGRKQEYAIAGIGQNWPILFRWSIYCIIIFLIGMFMSTSESPFIYFQF